MKFSDFPQAVIKENVDYTVKEITNVIKKYGPRESGNENCYAAQKHIKKEMDTFCDGTEFESYKMAPKAFLHFTKLVSVVIFLAVVACAILMYTSIITPLLAQCIVCGVVFVGLFITVMEFLLTHDRAARELGSAREVVTRMLRYFQQEGLVLLSRGKIRVLDEERLYELAGDSLR